MRLPVRPQLQPGPAAALIAVPAAWGSMFPAIKALDLEAAPPPFALLNFAIHFVGAVALWGLYRQAAATEPPPPVAAPEYQPNRRTPAVDCTPVDGQWSMVDGRWSPPSRLAAEAVEAPARRRRRRGLKSSKLVPRQLVPRRVLPVSPAPATPSLLAVRLPPVPLPPPSPSAWPAPARAAAAAAQPPLSVAWDELRAAQSAVELGALLSLAQACRVHVHTVICACTCTCTCTCTCACTCATYMMCMRICIELQQQLHFLGRSFCSPPCRPRCDPRFTCYHGLFPFLLPLTLCHGLVAVDSSPFTIGS